MDGKVKSIDRTSGSTKKNLKFDYDAMGHRIAKHVYGDGWSLQKSTYYVLDAQGIVMGVYEREVNDTASSVTFQLTENYIYGSSRLGVRNTSINLLSTTLPLPTSAYTVHEIGKKTFELTNHLNNVLSEISDRPIPHDDGNGTIDYFLADVRTCSDYSGFGAVLRERTMTLSGTGFGRYSFQSQEHDDEIKGEGNSVNFEYRMHDPRVGRFYAIDPLTKKYPELSTYSFSGNRVIDAIELEGREPQGSTLTGQDLDILLKPTSELTYGDMFTYRWNQAMGHSGGTARDISAGGIQATHDFMYRTYNFVTSSAWKGSTWAGIGQGLMSLMYFSQGPIVQVGLDRGGTNYTQSVAGFASSLYSLPKWNTYQWSYNTTTLFWNIVTAKAITPKSLYTISKGSTLLEKIGVRQTLASDFYKLAGYEGERLASHLAGINFNKPVRTLILKKGTIIQQWVKEGEVGNYFTAMENGAAKNLGIDYEGRTLQQFVLTEDVKVLETTAADFHNASTGATYIGGGKQFFGKSLKAKIKKI